MYFIFDIGLIVFQLLILYRITQMGKLKDQSLNSAEEQSERKIEHKSVKRTQILLYGFWMVIFFYYILFFSCERIGWFCFTF